MQQADIAIMPGNRYSMVEVPECVESLAEQVVVIAYNQVGNHFNPQRGVSLVKRSLAFVT